MGLPRFLLFALCLVLAGVINTGSTYAQQDKPIDLKPLIPPVLPPLPPNSHVTSGAVTSTPIPGTANTPPSQAPTQSAPGFRFSIPVR
jgi:hypothetical protein